MTRPDPARHRSTATAAPVNDGSPRPGHMLCDGDRLGRRYLLERRIGSGGMSVVWRAWDEALQRPVAVKVLDAPLSAGLGDRELIRREARAAARIDHPHAMGVYDVGETITSGGRIATYVVMRLLDGESLADRLDRGPLRWRQAVTVAARIAEVLAAAHNHGVVHRDVTPENVMLTSEGAKLLDFGIAAQIGERDDELNSPLFGTPPYVAPERLRGARAEGATDMYALGVLLFQMLTGRTPYPEITWEELELATRTGQPPRPSGVVGLPGRVARICQSCLAADPGARPTAEEVSDELAEALAADPRLTNLRGRRLAGIIATAATVAGLAGVATALTAPALFGFKGESPTFAVSTDPTRGRGTPAPSATPPSHAGSPAAPTFSQKPGGPSGSPAPAGPSGASASSGPPRAELTVAEAKAAIYASLTSASAAGTIRQDVATDLNQQVENVVTNQSNMPAAERRRQIEGVRASVNTRRRSQDLPERLAAELDAYLTGLLAAMDRAGGPQG